MFKSMVFFSSILLLFSGASAVIAPVKLISIGGTVADDPFPMKRMSLPIEGVKVRLFKPYEYVIMDQVASIVPTPGEQIDSALTTADGKFKFPLIASGSYTLTFDKAAFISRQITIYSDKDTAFTILLLAQGSMGSVAGTVTETCSNMENCLRKPVSGCTVTVSKYLSPVRAVTEQLAIVAPVILTKTYKEVTNASGEYIIDSIPLTANGESISVTASKAGLPSRTIDTVVTNSVTRINFSLVADSPVARDSVSVEPQKPSTIDSLKFTLSMFNHCCGTRFHNNNVVVMDSTISLSFTYDDSLCAIVDCMAGWSHTTFTSKPIKAGTYSVYESSGLYCPPNSICPLGVLAPVYLGRITISTPTAVIPTTEKGFLNHDPGFCTKGSIASITLAKNSLINVRVFNLSGALVANLLDGNRSAGKFQFDLRNMLPAAAARGTLIVQLSVDGTVQGARTVVLSR